MPPYRTSLSPASRHVPRMCTMSMSMSMSMCMSMSMSMSMPMSMFHACAVCAQYVHSMLMFMCM